MYFTNTRFSAVPAKAPDENPLDTVHRWGDFPFDFDDEESPETAQADIGRLLEYFIQLGVDEWTLRPYFSEKKGFHLTVPAKILGAEGGDPLLPKVYKIFASRLKAKLGLNTLDLTIYNMGYGRQFRIPNVRRENGTHKIPLLPNELELPIEQLREMASEPRTDIDDEFEDPKPCPALQDMFQRALAEAHEQVELESNAEPLDDKQKKQLQEIDVPACIKKVLGLRQKTAKLNFNKIVYAILILYCHAAGLTVNQTLSLAKPLIQNYQSGSYNSPQKRSNEIKAKWFYEKGGGYTFNCQTVRSLVELECSGCPLRRVEGLELDEVVDLTCKEQRGCAELFVRLHTSKLYYDHTDGVWYGFKEHFWTLEKIGVRLKQATDRVQEAFRKTWFEISGELVLLGQKIKTSDDEEEQEDLIQRKDELEQHQHTLGKVLKNLNTLKYRKQVVEFAAQGEGSLGITGEEWDQQPWSLPCPNGVIDLTTGQLRNGKPEDYLRAACPTRYDPDTG